MTLQTTTIHPYLITRFLHTGLLIFGISALISGDWAEGYEDSLHLGFIIPQWFSDSLHRGFTIHQWIGVSMIFFVSLRLIYGFIGPSNVRFSQLIPTTKDRLHLIGQDLLRLIRFQLPTVPTHQGLSGIIKLYGLTIFTWMALTGSIMFVLIEPGTKARGFLHTIMELHEIGKPLILIYLVLHIGITIFYALKGHHLWKNMFFLQ